MNSILNGLGFPLKILLVKISEKWSLNFGGRVRNGRHGHSSYATEFDMIKLELKLILELKP